MILPRSVLSILAIFSVGAFVVAWRANGLTQTQADVARELDALARTGTDLRELSDLKSQREVVAAAKRPTQDVIAQVNAVLRDAGLPTALLKNLEPEADVPLAGRYRTQTIRISLDHVSLRDVGSFLAAWRAAKTVWTPRTIELTQVAAPESAGASLDARIVIAATYLSDTNAESPP